VQTPLVKSDFASCDTQYLGEVDVLWGGRGVLLHGDYVFSLGLHRKDVARLFIETFAEVDLKTILDLLEGAGREGTTENERCCFAARSSGYLITAARMAGGTAP